MRERERDGKEGTPDNTEQHGWILKTYWVKEDRHKRVYRVWFYLYKHLA